MTDTIAPTTNTVPEWTLADRLAKSRIHAGLSREALADLLDVSTKTIARAEQGRYPATRRTVLAWAQACGVNAGWLVTGANTARYWCPDDDDFTESENDCYMLAA